MDIDWDPGKRVLNLYTYQIDLAEVEAVFFDPNAMTLEDSADHDEPRLLTLGLDGQTRMLVVGYILRGDTLRIISARRATACEISLYRAHQS